MAKVIKFPRKGQRSVRRIKKLEDELASLLAKHNLDATDSLNALIDITGITIAYACKDSDDKFIKSAALLGMAVAHLSDCVMRTIVEHDAQA